MASGSDHHHRLVVVQTQGRREKETREREIGESETKEPHRRSRRRQKRRRWCYSVRQVFNGKTLSDRFFSLADYSGG
ncbi:hypothetical protein Hdeb2414_s0015g00445341 [Helianthus debilis subsp. tardiflorus]